MKQNGNITITLPPAARWLVATVVIATATFAAVTCARWALAESILQIARTEPIPPYMLETAYSLQPGNPEAAYALGLYTLDQRQPPDVNRAMQLLDKAVELAPNRPELWLGVAHAREMEGDVSGAETAIRRADTLAPGHWKPDWALANLYIRNARLDESLVPLRRAVETNAGLAPLAIRTVWTSSGGNFDMTARVAAGSASATNALIEQLIADKRIDDAWRLWSVAASTSGVGPDVKVTGTRLADLFFAANRPDDGFAIWRVMDAAAVPEVGVVQNGGFEQPIADATSNPFGWKVTQSPEARVMLAPGHEGGQALRVEYAASGGKDFVHATETLRLEPDKQYKLSFWAATDDLVSAGLPVVELDGVGCVLPRGTTEWARYELTVRAPASGLAVIRVVRRPCSDVCPIFGSVTVDDMVLQKL